MTIPEAIVSLVQRHHLKPPFLVGFSGGADSTALLLGMLQATVGEFTAVHFHHGLRGAEADADETWCREFCTARSIPFLSRHLDVPHNTLRGESCEEAARRLRLEAWQELAANTPVFLAHHADDALEELFLRLARGSNASALVPLKPMRQLHGLTFLRPLLAFRKAELEKWLRSQGINDWRIDSTNAESAFRRNAVRNRLLPLFREIFTEDTGLLHALSALRDDAAFLDDSAANAFASLRSLHDWQALPPALLPRVLRLWLEANGVATPPTRPVITRLREALQSPHPKGRIPLDGSHAIELHEDGPRFVPIERTTNSVLTAHSFREPDSASVLTAQLRGESSPPGTNHSVLTAHSFRVRGLSWNWRETPLIHLGAFTFCVGEPPEGALTERFDASALPDTLHIRHWQPGDRMLPFGATAPKKLQDLFTDAKVPRSRRTELPLLLADEQIIWVPTVRRAAFGAIHEKTAATITISFKENL